MTEILLSSVKLDIIGCDVYWYKCLKQI